MFLAVPVLMALIVQVLLNMLLRAGISIPRMADSQLYYGRQISMSELRPGDLIFFSTYEPGASHCGIYLGDGKFIHAGTSTGVVVADAFTGYWGERYYGACRVL